LGFVPAATLTGVPVPRSIAIEFDPVDVVADPVDPAEVEVVLELLDPQLAVAIAIAKAATSNGAV
jgi:hypothetical protein